MVDDAMKADRAAKQQEAIKKIMADQKVTFEEAIDIYIKNSPVIVKASGRDDMLDKLASLPEK